MTAQHAVTETSSTGAAQADPEEAARRPGRRRAGVIVTILLLTAAGTIGAIVVLRDGEATSATGNQTKLGTAPVTRGDVVDTESVDGKLEYANARTVPASADGVVTWVPAEGVTLKRGQTVLKVGDEPVVLMYGSLPLYRTLESGVEGRDVRQLEDNLKALGYAGDLTVDSEYTSATADAVEEWQEAVGLPETGKVDSSQVVFQPGPIRVSEVKLARGARASGAAPALTVTDPQAIVHVDLEAGRQNLVTKNQEVTITMPGGSDVKGKVTSVGAVAKPNQDGDATIGVDITVSLKEAARIDQLPVTVALVSERATDVLSVPIEALLGLQEGGFGVEVVADDGTTRIIQVKTGVYGGGRVEVTGTGLQEGMKVGVPSS